MSRLSLLAVAALLTGACWGDEPERPSAVTEPSLSAVPADTAMSSVCRSYLRELREVQAREAQAAEGAAADSSAVPATQHGLSMEAVTQRTSLRALQLKIVTLDEVMSDACR